MNIKWRCNLDNVMTYEKFPTTLTYRPMVGDLVRSLNHSEVELCVVRCGIINTDTIEVELHLAPSQINIEQWQKWYRSIR